LLVGEAGNRYLADGLGLLVAEVGEQTPLPSMVRPEIWPVA
jgi:hypothetical protein